MGTAQHNSVLAPPHGTMDAPTWECADNMVEAIARLALGQTMVPTQEQRQSPRANHSVCS